MDPGARDFWRLLTIAVVIAVVTFEYSLKRREAKRPKPAAGKRSVKRKDPRPAFYTGLFVIVTIIILAMVYTVSRISF